MTVIRCIRRGEMSCSSRQLRELQLISAQYCLQVSVSVVSGTRSVWV